MSNWGTSSCCHVNTNLTTWPPNQNSSAKSDIKGYSTWTSPWAQTHSRADFCNALPFSPWDLCFDKEGGLCKQVWWPKELQMAGILKNLAIKIVLCFPRQGHEELNIHSQILVPKPAPFFLQSFLPLFSTGSTLACYKQSRLDTYM